MPTATNHSHVPGLVSYLKSLKDSKSESSIENLISLLKRRQIRQSRPCAIATTHLFLKIIADSRFKSSFELIENVRDVGRRLSTAQPKEITPGNIARRVLGLIREISEPSPLLDKGDSDRSIPQPDERPSSPKAVKRRSLEIISEPISMKDLKDDILNGLRELLDELDQSDERISRYSKDFVYANETILTYTSSLTVQKFLLQNAKRRKFTVIHVEGYPNEHHATYDTIINGRSERDFDTAEQAGRLKALTEAGINVIIVPDAAILAMMARVDKVILSAHAVFPNGGVIAAAGTGLITQAARALSIPILVLSPIFKLTPVYPFIPTDSVEIGSSGKVIDSRDGQLVRDVEVINPTSEYIEPENVDTLITNIGGFDTSYIYRIVADHYWTEDTSF